MKITVLYSLPTDYISASSFAAADSDTGVIAAAVGEGLRYLGYEVELFPVSSNKLAAISRVSSDCVFNLIEWCGREIALSRQAFRHLRALNIPVTGSSEKLFVLTGDKIALKKALLAHRLPVPPGIAFSTGDEPIPDNLPYPVIVKPSTEHCSIGLSDDSLVHNPHGLRSVIKSQIRQFAQPALVEEFIAGRELEVYLLERNGKLEILPIEELFFDADNAFAFQTFKSKWDETSPDYQSIEMDLAELSASDRHAVETVSRQTFTKLGFYGYARLDIRLRDHIPYILEANANPSVYDDPDGKVDPTKEIIWGITFADYLQAIVTAAFTHFRRGDPI